MYPLNIFVSAIYMQFGTILLDKLRPKVQLFLGGFLFSSSIYAMSYTRSYLLFLVLQSVVNAAGMGLIYMLPVRNAWMFYPRKKGMVSGIILMCYSIGAIIWSFMTTMLVNPDNIPPTLRI
jgi:MFS transporter, OFA family, oxalate/formate antiporter